MNINEAISLGMSSDDDPEKKKARASRAEVSEWWVRYAERWHRDHGGGQSHTVLGVELARLLKREEPFSYVTIGRFFRMEITTGAIADGLMLLYPDLPPWKAIPQDLEEALEIQAVQRRAADRRQEATAPRAPAPARDPRVASLTAKVLQRVGAEPTPDPSEPQRHTADLASKDAEQQEAGRPGRGSAGRRGVGRSRA